MMVVSHYHVARGASAAGSDITMSSTKSFIPACRLIDTENMPVAWTSKLALISVWVGGVLQPTAATNA